MRYISPYDETVIFQNDGAIRHKFFQGELIVGDPATKATAADQIDFTTNATDATKDIQFVYKTDEAGATTDRSQMCGLGALNPLSVKGIYYEAPYIKVGATSVPATAGLFYKVAFGIVTYKGTAYKAGDIFVSDGTVVVTTGDNANAMFAAYFPPEIKSRAMDNRKALFREQHLETGNEAVDYHLWTALGGFLPKNQLSNPATPGDLTIAGAGGYGYVD